MGFCGEPLPSPTLPIMTIVAMARPGAEDGIIVMGRALSLPNWQNRPAGTMAS